MVLSRILEVIVSFSPFKFITDWRHENTLREQSRLQAQVEMRRIDGEQRKELIETVRLLIREGQVTDEMSAKIVRSALTNEPSQDVQPPPGARTANRSRNHARLNRVSPKSGKGVLN